jgi:hypothetical protein
MTIKTRQLGTTELEDRVKRMYEVAREPERDFHFETGRALAQRLGYPSPDLDRIPAPAIDSFAGVGYFLDLAAIKPGEAALDLGSGSGTDSSPRARLKASACHAHIADPGPTPAGLAPSRVEQPRCGEQRADEAELAE